MENFDTGMILHNEKKAATACSIEAMQLVLLWKHAMFVDAMFAMPNKTKLDPTWHRLIFHQPQKPESSLALRIR
jgi:hypothetical protein